jgi:hypothetical protein
MRKRNNDSSFKYKHLLLRHLHASLLGETFLFSIELEAEVFKLAQQIRVRLPSRLPFL